MPGVLGGKINFSWSGNQGAHAGWRGVTSNSSLQSKPSTLSAHPASRWKDPETNHTKAMKHDIFVYFVSQFDLKRSPSFMQHVWKKRLLRTYGSYQLYINFTKNPTPCIGFIYLLPLVPNRWNFTRTSSGTYIPATRVWYLAKVATSIYFPCLYQVKQSPWKTVMANTNHK